MRLLMLRSLLLAARVLFAPFATASPPPPTQSLGAFITPTDAWASSSQAAGRTARKLIDGSGWGERVPGSGVYVHTNDVFRDGSCMWNGDPASWLVFDLDRPYRVNGVYVWNYNEGGGRNSWGVKDVEVSASPHGTSRHRDIGSPSPTGSRASAIWPALIFPCS